MLKNIDEFDIQKIEKWYLFQHEGKAFRAAKVFFFLIFLFLFPNKNFKRIGGAKARLLLVDCVEITPDPITYFE